MVENKCSKCGNEVEYTITIRTDKEKEEYDFKYRIYEHWCFDCLRAKILWPKPVTFTKDTKVYGYNKGMPIVDPPDTNRPKLSENPTGHSRYRRNEG